MASAHSDPEEVKAGYGFGRVLKSGFETTIERAKLMLKEEGFGTLFEIDMKAKLKEKLGVDFRNYVILGVCNPPIAYQSLQAELNLGLLLPCNVVVYESEAGSAVVAIDAEKMLSIVGNPALQSAAALVNEKLQRAINRL